MNRRKFLRGAAVAAPVLAATGIAASDTPDRTGELIEVFRTLSESDQRAVVEITKRLTPEAHAERASKAKSKVN